MMPACFACNMDCATGCHTDDQPLEHPSYTYDHPPDLYREGEGEGEDPSTDGGSESSEDDLERSVHVDVSTGGSYMSEVW